MVSRFYTPVGVENTQIDQHNALTAYEQAWGQGATRETGVRLVGLMRKYPWLSRDQALSAAMAGYDADSEDARLLASISEAKRRAKEDTGYFSAFKDTVSGYADPLKPAVRTIAVAGDAVWQETVGRTIRGVAAASDIASRPDSQPGFRSSAGEFFGALTGAGDQPSTFANAGGSAGTGALADLLMGNKVDLGSGYGPGGELGAEAQRQQGQLTIRGRPISIGSLTADTFSDLHVVEEGSSAYNTIQGLTELGFELGSDPTAAALGTLSKATKLQRGFQAASRGEALISAGLSAKRAIPLVDRLAERGAIRSIRKIGQADVADAWLRGTNEGRNVVSHLAGETNPAAIYQATGRKFSPQLVTALADAPDAAAVREVLLPHLGTTLRDAPKFTEGAIRAERGAFDVNRVRSARLLANMPGQMLKTDEPLRAVETLENHLVNARVPAPQIQEHLSNFIRALSTEDPAAIYDSVVNGATGAVKASIAANLARAGKPAPVADALATRITVHWDEATADLRRYFTDAAGNNVPILGATIDDKILPLAKPHLQSEMLHAGIPLPDARSIRALTSKYPNLFTDPKLMKSVAALDFFTGQIFKPLALFRPAWAARVIGEEQVRMAASDMDSIFRHPLSFLSWRLGKKGATEFTDHGRLLEDAMEHAQALTAPRRSWIDPTGRVKLADRINYAKHMVEYPEAWAGELAMLNSDTLGSHAARITAPEDLAALKEQFWSGPLSELTRQKLGKVDDRLWHSRPFADAYVDSVAERLRIKTGGDADLINAVRDGYVKVGDKRAPIRKSNGQVNPAFVDYLAGKVEAGPATVHGQRSVRLSRSRTHLYDQVVDFLASTLMTERSNNLSRSPTFKQAYWARGEELLPSMSHEARATFAVQAEKAGLKDTADTARRWASAKPGTINIDEADLLAKAHGVDFTRDLLYELSTKGQWADVNRLVAPFAEAWKEVLTRWVELVARKPQIPLRATTIIEGAKESGFLHPNEQGQEMFTYPLSDQLTRLLGAPFPLEAPAGSLNLFSQSSFLPGVGPVIQWPAGKLLPDKPAFDGIRNWLTPFGNYHLTPGWLDKLQTAWNAPETDRMYLNTVQDVMKFKASTGKYDLHDAESVRQLETDSRKAARALLFVRAAGQFVLPAAPRPQAMVEDPKNADQALVTWKLTDEFHKMQEDNPDTAVETFLAKYGTDMLLVMQDRTRALSGALPPTEQTFDWVRTHRDIVADYRNTVGLFAPGAHDPDFNYRAYEEQIRTGQRVALDPEQFTRLANSRVAASMYAAKRAAVGRYPNGPQREWLGQWHDFLVEEYPGYGDSSGLPERASFDVMLAELTRAGADKRLAENTALAGTAAYLDYRTAALEEADKRGLKTLAGKKAADLRAWLREKADDLSAVHDGFSDLYDRILSREVKD